VGAYPIFEESILTMQCKEVWIWSKFYMCRLAMNSLANTGASKVIRFISASGSTFKRCHKNARETRSHQVKAGVTWDARGEAAGGVDDIRTTFGTARVQCWCTPLRARRARRPSHSIQTDASKSFPKLGIPLIHSQIKKAYVRDYLRLDSKDSAVIISGRSGPFS
jgi:hypothetical protein